MPVQAAVRRKPTPVAKTAVRARGGSAVAKPAVVPVVRKPQEAAVAAAMKSYSSDPNAPRREKSIAPGRSSLLKNLGGRSSLARAMVLKEILDVPLSLRTKS